MVVRPAEARDARAIAEVHTASWRAAYRGLLPDWVLDGLSVDEREGAWRELVASGEQLVLVAVDPDGGVVGFCAVSGPASEVTAIYVDPGRFRSGAGTALMDAAEAWLRERGSSEVALWVLPGNEPALAFYRRRGFEPDGAEKRVGRSLARVVRLRAVL